MESFIHLTAFGELVRTERKRLKLSQVDFYLFLFPDTNKAEETIKKKMNSIENGKQKSIDFDFLLAVCQKCDVSADYILGIKPDYRNYTNEYICNYTGLNENAVSFLHGWSVDKNNEADLSLIGEAFWEEHEEEVNKAYKKQTAITFLRIINYLFMEGELPADNTRKTRETYCNLRILHSLYLMCMAKPISITGTPVIDDADLLNEYLNNDLCDPFARHYIWELMHPNLDGSRPVFMEDDNHVHYPVSMKDVLEQIARRQLDRNLDQLIAAVNNDEP